MLVKVGGAGGSDGEGMDLRPAQAKEGVEGHGTEGLGQASEEFRRLVEHAALVVRADDKHPHVILLGGPQRPVMVLENVVPVQIDIIEPVSGDEFLHQIGGAVGGKTNPSAQAFFLKPSGQVQTAPRP